MKISSTRLAAAGTVVALGALGAIAFAAGSSSGPTTTPSAAATPRPKVRTIVEHRDVYVTRNAKRSQATPTGTPAATLAVAAASDPAAAQPVPATDRSAGNEVDERGGHAEPGDDHGDDAEPGENHDDHLEPGDDHAEGDD